MYQYRYCVTTAKKIDNIEYYKEQIEESVLKFNDASHRAKNYKNIAMPIKYHKETMEFILESEKDLGDHPSLRPLWLFSKLLLEVAGLNDYCINKRFLKAMVIKREGIDERKIKLNDREVLKILIDIYMPGNNSSYMNRLNKEVKIKINNIINKYVEEKE